MTYITFKLMLSTIVKISLFLFIINDYFIEIEMLNMYQENKLTDDKFYQGITCIK